MVQLGHLPTVEYVSQEGFSNISHGSREGWHCHRLHVLQYHHHKRALFTRTPFRRRSRRRCGNLKTRHVKLRDPAMNQVVPADWILQVWERKEEEKRREKKRRRQRRQFLLTQEEGGDATETGVSFSHKGRWSAPSGGGRHPLPSRDNGCASKWNSIDFLSFFWRQMNCAFVIGFSAFVLPSSDVQLIFHSYRTDIGT